jgi:hypothetical protein
MDIEVVDFIHWEKNTLKGFFTVELSDKKSKLGIIIPGFMLHDKNGNCWIEFPSKPSKGNNGSWEKTIYTYDKRKEKLLKETILKELDKFLYKNNITM